MKKSTTAEIALFITAMLQGGTFTIGKLAAEAFSASFIIAFRFLVASPLLVVAFPKRKQLDRKFWIHGFWKGLTLFVSYILQVGGLILDTSPVRHILCVFLCLAGMGIFSLTGGRGMSADDFLTVASGVPCAMNIVISSLVCKNRNVRLLTTIELCVVTILAWICVVAGSGLPVEYPVGAVGGIVYLGLITTSLCLYMQSYGLKYAEPAIGGMIITAILLSQWEEKSQFVQ